MRNTIKHRKKKQVKRKYKSKRLGGGGPRESEAAVPYLIGERLNATSLRSHNQTFREPGLVSQVLKGVPIESVTLALKNADYKKEVAHLLSKKFKKSAKSRAIASKIVDAIPTTDVTLGRKKQTLLKELKIAQEALAAHIVAIKPIDDYKDKLSIIRDNLVDELKNLEGKFNKLEKSIGYPKLDNYDNLKTKYDEVTRSQSMLERSRAPLIGIKLKTLRYGSIGKLYALKDKINITDKLYTKADEDYAKANEHYNAAHEEQDRLSLIVHNLKKQLRDLEDL
jgi:hypothetical protein